jgi:hypothetical protein
MGRRRYATRVNAVERRNDLLLTASFANTLARLVANYPEICDEPFLLELLALADRAEEALQQIGPRAD